MEEREGSKGIRKKEDDNVSENMRNSVSLMKCGLISEVYH